ncbi:unnamed protein product, partial [Coffea canephora]
MVVSYYNVTLRQFEDNLITTACLQCNIFYIHFYSFKPSTYIICGFHFEGRPHVKTSLTGVFIDGDKSNTNNLWTTFTALGNLAFAYGFSEVLIEIQDTLGSSKPENRVMKQASLAGISISTLFYMSCGLLGYAAFGDKAPGNILAGFGFFEPFWLIDLANIFVVIHHTGAYQICGQLVFGFVESFTRHRWPNTGLVNHEYAINMPGYGVYRVTLFRIIWRTTYVIITTVIAMMFPFFNDIVGLIGALSFWPLTVYFPIKMRIEREKIPIFSFKWVWMQTLSMLWWAPGAHRSGPHTRRSGPRARTGGAGLGRQVGSQVHTSAAPQADGRDGVGG